jgi:hypothetical protein
MPELEPVPPSPTARPDADVWKDPVIEAYKKDVDRTLIRHTLSLTVEQRLRNLEACLADAAELRRAMRAATTGR